MQYIQKSETKKPGSKIIYGIQHTGLDNKKFHPKIVSIFLHIILAYVLGAQNNRLIETVLLSTHNICFGSEIIKLFFCYSFLSKSPDGKYNVTLTS